MLDCKERTANIGVVDIFPQLEFLEDGAKVAICHLHNMKILQGVRVGETPHF